MFSVTVFFAVLAYYTSLLSFLPSLAVVVLPLLSSCAYNLSLYYIVGNEGFCYEIAFQGGLKVVALAWLGKYPGGADVEFLFFLCSGGANLHDYFKTVNNGGILHLTTFEAEGWCSPDDPDVEFIYGSYEGAGRTQAAAERLAPHFVVGDAFEQADGYLRYASYKPVRTNVAAQQYIKEFAHAAREDNSFRMPTYAETRDGVGAASHRLHGWHGPERPSLPRIERPHMPRPQLLQRGYQAARAIPTKNQVQSQANTFVSRVRAEFPVGMPSVNIPHPHVHAAITDVAASEAGRGFKQDLDRLSALECGKVLLSGMDSMGDAQLRIEMIQETLKAGIPTSIAPSDPAFHRLVKLVGPLKYSPRMTAHGAAATIRLAALDHAATSLQGSIVGLISPSRQELHAFPNAVVWEYTDALDKSRRRKACTRCKAPQCSVYEKLRGDGRVFVAQDWQRGADHFKKFGVINIVMLNIEPNMNARTVVKVMVRAEVYNALSLSSVDWRVILGTRCFDSLTGMTTERSFGKIVSSFHDSGDYVQSEADVRQLFAPTFAAGHALRRTTIFADHANQYQELTLVNGGWATRCVPSHEKFYFIKLIMPDGTRPAVPVERAGFDRVLATYRTQAIKDRSVARIVLRQSVVTYSIAGTQVTPRIALTAAQAEALAVWTEIYSEVQDVFAEQQAERLRPKSMAGAVQSGLYKTVASRIMASAPDAMGLQSMSAVEAILSSYRSEFGEMTLEQMSERSLEEHFGTKLEPASLQNVLISKWQSFWTFIKDPSSWMKKITRVWKDTWKVSFGYLDAIMVLAFFGVDFSITAVEMIVDCIRVAARISGKQDSLKKIDEFLSYLQWQSTKRNRFWVTVQDTQRDRLDFQAATIDIVETFFNVFGTDHAAEIQAIKEKNLLDHDQLAELELNAALPYSDFLSELKLFLGRINSHTRRLAMSHSLLNAFHHDCREVPDSVKAKLIHTLKQEAASIPTPAVVKEMAWLLSDVAPETCPIPLKPINYTDIREAFKIGKLEIPTGGGNVTLRKLEWVDGKVDFGPIHTLMDLQHTDVVNPANLRGPNYISPDERGVNIQRLLVNYSAENATPAIFCRRQHMLPYYTAVLANPTIPYVDKVMREQAQLFQEDSAAKWIAHMTGFAMGGKSKNFEDWVTANDLIIVPTLELKNDWLGNLGKLDPIRRASVVTQHVALEAKYASRYVIIDECYAFDPEHLQAIANRHQRCKGIITIGDKRQISNVFSPTGQQLSIAETPCVMISPVSFTPWDTFVEYFNNTTSDVFIDNVFCGGTHAEGLVYTLEANDVLQPGEGDLAIQGTQVGKELVNARGVPCNTTHECQGRRSNKTVVHTVGRALSGDLRWLGMPEQRAHLGVTITRSRNKTIFVLDSKVDMRVIPWFDDSVINGALPTTVIRGGTSWDFAEARAESESIWEHLYEPNIIETGLVETALTDPVTIGTVFTSDGEPISSNEIATDVALISGVTFTDESIPLSDRFDNYTFQPRDVPGADQVQALTRTSHDVAPRATDASDAEQIVEWIFEEVLDKKTFFAHVNNSRRCAIKRKTRQQVIDGCYARYEDKASTYSFAFLKPEFSKKESVMPGELKAQGVVSGSDMQQLMFSDVCDALTHAWARSMQPGKLSPVGLKEEEVEDFLSTFEKSYELDIEKQDSSHKPVHVLVATIFLDMVAERLGYGAMAKEIRQQRTVRMMSSLFKFVLETSLASGDQWTLIINKIMAVSSLISVAELKDVRMAQSGDDVTLDREPTWRENSLRDQTKANVGLRWKVEERDQRRNGVTFISRAILPNRTVVYKALRTILKYAWRPRNQIQHAGIKADASRITRLAAKHGLQAYAEARAQVWGGDPVVIYDLWTRALKVANAPFESLPEDLKRPEPRQYTIRSRDGGCFGYALANCVVDNVAAINAIATYRGPVSQSVALTACKDNKVPIIFVNEKFANRSRTRLQDQMDRRSISRSFVVCYEDHAVAVVPNTLTLHGGFGKRQITWKFTDSRDVTITDFE